MGILNRLDHRGHGPVAKWSKDRVSREKASAAFAEHVAKGYTMYDITEPPGMTPGEALGKKLEEFDPEAGEILAVPRLVAG